MKWATATILWEQRNGEVREEQEEQTFHISDNYRVSTPKKVLPPTIPKPSNAGKSSQLVDRFY